MEQSSIGKSLKALRARAGMSVREVADALGRPASTYASYEDKFKKPYLPMELALELVRVWSPRGVARGDILALTGLDQGASDDPAATDLFPGAPRANIGGAQKTPSDINIRDMPRDVPVLGIAACGEDGLFEMQGEVIDYARRPPRLTGVPGAYCLYVHGSSMAPWREHGQKVYASPAQPAMINDYVVVQLKPARPGEPAAAYIKRLIRRNDGEMRLQQFNPPKEITIKMSKVAAVHRIIDWDELMGI
jgi:phage repressor protein C with HTH and peptisase S24 domain